MKKIIIAFVLVLSLAAITAVVFAQPGGGGGTVDEPKDKPKDKPTKGVGGLDPGKPPETPGQNPGQPGTPTGGTGDPTGGTDPKPGGSSTTLGGTICIPIELQKRGLSYDPETGLIMRESGLVLVLGASKDKTSKEFGLGLHWIDAPVITTDDIMEALEIRLGRPCKRGSVIGPTDKPEGYEF